MTNALAWLESRSPAPPAALARRLRESLGKAPGDATASAACLDAGVELLKESLRDGRPEQERSPTALNLLTADALVTYAFEAAAEDIDSLEQRATEAMLRLSALDGPSA